jgi:nucleotide-binding universal stress UspA family protein
MFDRILVPLDRSRAGEAILPAAVALARSCRAQVILATLEEPNPQDPGPGFVEESADFDQDYLVKVARALEKEGLQAKVVVRGGPVAEGLLAIAREERASLIAMSTHGRTASGLRPFGGVAEQLLRGCPVPILAAPSLSRAPGVRTSDVRLLVTTDGSQASRAIVPAAQDFAACTSAKVLLVRLVSPGAPRGGPEQDLHALLHRFQEKGLDGEALIEDGDPHVAIPEIAHRRGITTIAMSTRAGAGSVAQAVLRDAGVPLLVVRARPPEGSPGP